MIARVRPELLPPTLAAVQIVDFTEPGGRAAFDLMAALSGLPPAKPLPDPLPEPPPVPLSYLSDLSERIQAPRLDLDEQLSLIGKLRAGLGRPDERDTVLELIRRLRARNDLYLTAAQNLDELLAATPPATREHDGSGSARPGPAAAVRPARPRRPSAVPIAALIAAIVAVGVLALGLLVGARVTGLFGGSGPSTAASSSPTATPSPQVIVKTVEIPGKLAIANQENWIDTGIDVSRGDRVTVDPTGMVRHNDTDPAVGPDGDNRPHLQQYSVLPSAPHAALIGKVNSGGNPFLVGTQWRTGHAADDSGRLFLGVNDKDSSNNSGMFIARIEVRKP
jgi:hypothetical protein